jgi:hypothetical protein
LIVVVFAIGRFLLSDAYALASTIQDDSFYYIIPAYNLKSVGFFTFDGRNPTYGFQPLYMILLSVFGFFFTSLPLFLSAVLLLNALAHIATALVIFFTIATALHGKAAPWRYCFSLAGGLMYLLNMNVFLANTTGKENALAALVLSAAVLVSLRLFASSMSGKDSRASWSAMMLGVLAGALIICRVLPTTLLLVTITCVFAFPRLRSRTVFVAATLAPPTLWGLYALATFGRILPTSGAVKAGSFIPHLSGIGPATVLSMMHDSLAYLKNSVLFSLGLSHHLYVPQLDLRMPTMGFSGHCASLVLFIVLGALCMISVAVVGPKQIISQQRIGLLLCLTFATAGGYIITAVLLHFRGGEIFYYSWYVFDLPVLLPMILAITAGELSSETWSARGDCVPHERAGSWPPVVGKAIPTFLWGLVALACLAGTGYTFRRIQPVKSFGSPVEWQETMIRSGLWARNELGLRGEERVGAFNAGALGFVLPGQVVNLDGLANDTVVSFRKAGGTWPEYVAQERLDYYMDVYDESFLGSNGVNHEIVRKVPFGSREFLIARLR